MPPLTPPPITPAPRTRAPSTAAPIPMNTFAPVLVSSLELPFTYLFGCKAPCPPFHQHCRGHKICLSQAACVPDICRGLNCAWTLPAAVCC